GYGQVQPHRPRIAGDGSGDDSEAAVGITGMVALARDWFRLPEPGPPLDANYSLPLRPPQHPVAGPLQGQHPSGQCHSQRREAAAGGQPRQAAAGEGVEAARAPRIGDAVRAPDALAPALGPCVSRITGTAGQRNEQSADWQGQFVRPHHPQPVHGCGQILVECFGQVRLGLGTGHEVCYQATSTAHGDLFSHSSYPEGKPVTAESSTEPRTAAASALDPTTRSNTAPTAGRNR